MGHIPKINKTMYALLGILRKGPASGYDIKKFCDTSISFFWTENYAQIYPMLKQMEASGLVTKTTETWADKPPRNVYAVTPAGEAELDNWLRQPVTQVPFRSELLLKIFLGRDLPPAVIEGILEEHRALVQANIDAFHTITERLETLYPRTREKALALFTLRHGILTQKAEMAWIEECLEILKSDQVFTEE